MLEPTDRRHLLDVLRPPEGYQLDCAIGTTFSLDLLALLTVPLAFTLFDWEDESGRPAADPLAILEALRRYSDRIHVFSQAGRIGVPSNVQLLFGYLEDSVIPVTAPRSGGVFHPKVWVLRFTAPEVPVRYRVLCLSRNLTFDRSWDTVLTLEGDVADRKMAFAVNHPLGNFVAALPNLAVQPVSERVRANINRVQDELRRVSFEPPPGFDEYAFWPLGIDGHRRWPFGGQIDRMLVVSPFLTPNCLHELTEQGSDHVLVSRLDSLAALNKKDLTGFNDVYALSSMAEPEEPEADAPELPLDPETPLAGLHAKLFVADDGWNAHIWTGSANATNAAFNANVEFLVELVGRKSACGVKAILETGGEQAKFVDLLQRFTPAPATLKPDPIQRQLEESLRSTQMTLATLPLTAQVDLDTTREAYHVHLSGNAVFEIETGVEVKCWPITLAPTMAIAISPAHQPLATFGPLASESLTAFFAFYVTAYLKDHSLSAQFVLRLPLVGAPEDRRERLLRSMLHDQNQVMRFLMLILSGGGADPQGSGVSVRSLIMQSTNGSNGFGETPLLEALIQTLHRDPARLDPIAHLVEDLERTREGRQLLPEGFQSIWRPIWEVRQRLLK